MMKLNLLAMVFLVLHAACDYDQEDLEEFVMHIPDSGREEFLRYALSQGYSSVERRPLKGHPPRTPELFGELYEYYLKWHRVEESAYYKDPRNIICFPNAGCVDISDTSIYP